MKKLLIILLSVLVIACNKKTDDTELRNFVTKKLTKNKGSLDLKNYNNVSWDRVYIVGPYSNHKMYDSTLYKYKQTIMETGVESEDQQCLLMLFKGKILASEVLIDRRHIDFTNATRIGINATIQPYEREKAVFPYFKQKGIYYIQQF